MTDSISRTLSDAKVRNAKPGIHPKTGEPCGDYKLADGGGLSLLVQLNGSKLWRYKFRLHGVEGTLAIGAYPDVSLATARDAHNDARKLVAAGKNPVTERQVARREASQALMRAESGTFALALASWQDATEPDLGTRTIEWRRWECGRHLIPEFGQRKVWEITRQEIAKFLLRVQKTAPSVAKIVRTYLVHIFERAIDEGLLENSPVPSVRLLKRRKRWVSHQAMTLDRFPAFMSNLLAANVSPFTKGALLLIVLTACRKTEACGAKWSEFDLDKARWEIPKERMKMRRPHFVPLSRQAVKLLRALEEHSGGGEFVFPHYYKPNTPMHHTTVGLLMRKVRTEADTVHGFRSTFSTYMNGQKESEKVIEMCLAHADENVVRGIYNRYQYEDERRVMLQRWASDLDGILANAQCAVPKLDVVNKQLLKLAA